MTSKIQILILCNIILLFIYKLLLHYTNIKGKYDKWKEFYEKYENPPFSYLQNLLPFSTDEMFLKISDFVKKLSFFIANAGYNIEEYEEEDFHLDIINNNQYIINKNITKYKINDIDAMYDEYFYHSINEINILEDAIINENMLNIKPILEKGLEKNNIIILFIFFIQQYQIFQLLERNFDLNKIYYLQKNKTNIEELEEYHENLFNYEDNLEIILLLKQFVEYHKDLGFFDFDELKEKNIPTITKTEKNMVDLFIKLKYMDKDDYKSLNDFELSNFLCLFERTAKSVSCLGMADLLYQKGISHYNKDIIVFRIAFIFFGSIVNAIILIIDSEDDKIKKRKKYK